jgi:hypothetical protein
MYKKYMIVVQISKGVEPCDVVLNLTQSARLSISAKLSKSVLSQPYAACQGIEETAARFPEQVKPMPARFALNSRTSKAGYRTLSSEELWS